MVMVLSQHEGLEEREVVVEAEKKGGLDAEVLVVGGKEASAKQGGSGKGLGHKNGRINGSIMKFFKCRESSKGQSSGS